MTYQPIIIGSAPNDGTGDPLRTAGSKINGNTSELYTFLGANSGTLPSATGISLSTGKTLTVTSSLTLSGTDATTLTFPSVSQTIAGLAASQTFTNNQLINIPGAAGASLKITKNSSTNVNQSCLDLHTATAANSGRLIQFFVDTQDAAHPLAYFDDGVNFYSRTSATISGIFNGSSISGPFAGIVLSGEQGSYMLGTYGDTNINYASRMAPVSTPNGFQHAVFIGNQATGLTQGTPAPQMEGAILQQFQHAWGVSTTALTWDTFLGRGNAAASLQLGGWDTAAPIAQHLTTQNVAALAQSAADGNTAAGNALVSTSYGLPNTIFVGMTVTDVTNPGAIPGSTTILSIATNRQSFTMSANATGGGIVSGDTLQFTVPNTAGVGTFFDGSQGTGTGVGGTLNFRTAVAGSSGSSQNSLTTYLQVSGTATANQGQVQILGGGNSTPQLTFQPNSGNPFSIGMVNGGGELIVFDNGANQQIGIGGSTTLQLPNGGVFAFSSSAAVTGAGDTFLTRAGAASLQFGNTDANPAVAQTTKVQSATGSNIAGQNWTIIGSLSTGSGTSGDIIFETGGTGAGSTSQNTATEAMRIKGATQQVIFAGAVRINVAPTAVTHTVTISSAADSNSNLGHVMAFNFNGTTYYVPCGTVQP